MLNKVIIMGRITRDPELRNTKSGIEMCNFSVAVERPFKDKVSGEKITDFLDCAAFRGTAKFVCTYFKRGSMILVEGSIQNNHYTDDSGTKHYAEKIMVENVSFCGGKNEGGTSQTEPTHPGLPESVQNAVEQFEAIVTDPDSVLF